MGVPRGHHDREIPWLQTILFELQHGFVPLLWVRVADLATGGDQAEHLVYQIWASRTDPVEPHTTRICPTPTAFGTDPHVYVLVDRDPDGMVTEAATHDLRLLDLTF